MRLLSRALFAVGALGAGCVAYGTVIERRWYRLRRIRLPGVLTGRAERLTVLHVSDLHLVVGQDHRVRFLDSLATADHDLVVVTGDLVGAPGAEQVAVEALAPLTRGDRPGVVVLGSHDLFGAAPRSPLSYLTSPERRDHGDPLDTQRLVEGLAAHGYRTLRSEAAVIDTARGPVAVAGFDDPHLDPSALPSPASLAAPHGGVVARIGAVHAPYTAALDVLVDAGYDLLLAGHTHGGQVRLPGIGALVDNCDLPLDQARGASRYRDRWLHVSVGLGHSPYAPFRFACRPEATLLELA